VPKGTPSFGRRKSNGSTIKKIGPTRQKQSLYAIIVDLTVDQGVDHGKVAPLPGCTKQTGAQQGVVKQRISSAVRGVGRRDGIEQV